ncbi:MAG: anti-sigma factor [Pirellulales bacterium]|nr:anti-sigma factor [Pirellulales bacterium]
MITCDQCREELTELTLGPADAAQAERMAAHLAACPVCRQEFEELQAAWSALPAMLSPIQPRPEVFERVFARIDGDRAVVAAPSFQPSRNERIFSYVVAASIFLSVAAGLWQLSRPAGGDADAVARRSAEQLAERLGNLQEMERLLASKNVRLVALNPQASADATQAYVIWDFAARQWHFYASNLPAPTKGFEYQVWAAPTKGDPVAGPAFKVNAEGLGSAIIDVPKLDVRTPAKAIVTLEPAGGSKTPTGKVFLEAPL